MREQDVLAYLQQHPEFLLQHAATLGVRPEAGKVQSFAQAQWLAQQAKTEKMALQLTDMLHQAQANATTSARLMRFACRLMTANTLLQACRAASGGLKDDFDLPAHRLLLLMPPRKKNAVSEEWLLPVSHPAHAHLTEQNDIVCAPQLPAALLALLPDGGCGLESFLLLPLLDEGVVRGVVLAGDADENRFVADMPTDRVAELAQLMAVALARTGGW